LLIFLILNNKKYTQRLYCYFRVTSFFLQTKEFTEKHAPKI
jgi:hypothetical protein